MDQDLPFRCITQAHHSALASLQLAVYATDAMRVLRRIEQRANQSPDFEAAIRSACPDWRNPGSLEEPEDLLLCVLTHAVTAIQQLVDDPDAQTITAP